MKKITPMLAAATVGLLGGTSSAMAQKGVPNTWDVDTAVLFYSESDSRVSAIEPVFSATRNFDEDRKLNLKAVLDSLTGASPNGATPSDQVATFTSPSGNSSYQVQAGEAPLDTSFHDTRGAFSASWSAPLNRAWEYTAGVYGSGEYDYLSAGMNGSIKRYLNQKNTALNAGISLSYDQVKPVGGVPQGLSVMALRESSQFDEVWAASRGSANDNKTLVDVLFGVTQVINRQLIMQWNYSLSASSGYLTDPYKILSVIDTTEGENYGGNLLDSEGNPIYLYENRPDSRIKHSVYWQAKYGFMNGDMADVSYRFMTDDWGITSHTLESRYRLALGNYYLEPHVRYYMQSAADFYHRYLTAEEYNQGTPTLTEASSDYRLGEMDAYTFGLKFGWKLPKDREFSVRAEYYNQSSSGEAGFGKLANAELYPDNKAVLIQLGYSF